MEIVILDNFCIFNFFFLQDAHLKIKQVFHISQISFNRPKMTFFVVSSTF